MRVPRAGVMTDSSLPEFSNILVTGDSGFIGRHFRAAYGGVGLVDAAGIVDLRDVGRLQTAVSAVKPDAVLHLAAQSSVATSLQDAASTYAVNFLGTLNLLEALRGIGFKGVFLYVSSADVYGSVDETNLPVREEMPARPRSPYAVSKVAAEALCYQWSRSCEFRIVMVRPFNQIGPGHDPRFAVPDFARQIVEMKRGTRPPVLVTGDIEVTRDFTDVRDSVKALYRVLESGRNGEIYNLCTGEERTLSSLVHMMLELEGVKATLEVDAARLRPVEQRRMAGSYAKIREHLGWQPTIDIRTTLADILKETENRIHV
jgi:GDP-4-dehydro-6-deoxy-D-mannose reductase